MKEPGMMSMMEKCKISTMMSIGEPDEEREPDEESEPDEERENHCNYVHEEA